MPLSVQAPLPRQRLEARLAGAFGKRLTLVVAPAGSGKTTLLARFATTSGAAVGWYRAESWDADEGSFVRHLEASLSTAVPSIAGGWANVEDAARDLESAAGSRHGPVLLVIDDFYYLEDTAAEAAFGRLVDYAPGWLTIVVATRVAPGLNLSRLRLADDLLEIASDDLRFRAWEVEQLFRDVYNDPVAPADLAVLARRTEGWAAGLQLFHLATRGRSPEERRRVLGGPGSSGRLLREYLAQNVMAGLPVELQTFLLDTCVLGRLSGELCDRIRGAGGSGALLDELARRGVFTVPVEDGSDAYRYHEVLRQHLDRKLVEEIGEAAARDRHGRAGRLLEDAGAYAEALRAFSRAEDWTSVRRLLGGEGERLAASREGRWIEELPPAIERHDPWVALAAARRARNDGRWAAALAAYAHAETVLGPARAAEGPRAERLTLAAWLDPGALPQADVSGALRTGLVRDPGHAARELGRRDEPGAEVARGLLLLAAGDVVAARRVLADAADHGDADAFGVAVARLGATVADVLAGSTCGPRAFDGPVEAAEHAGSGWLARLGRMLAELLTGGEAGHGGEAVVVAGDPWGAAIARLAAAWGGNGGPEAAARLGRRGRRRVPTARCRGARGVGTVARRPGRRSGGPAGRPRPGDVRGGPRAGHGDAGRAPARPRGARRGRPGSRRRPSAAAGGVGGGDRSRAAALGDARARVRRPPRSGWPSPEPVRHRDGRRPVAGVRTLGGLVARDRRAAGAAGRGQAAGPVAPAVPRDPRRVSGPSRGDPGGAVARRRRGGGRPQPPRRAVGPAQAVRRGRRPGGRPAPRPRRRRVPARRRGGGRRPRPVRAGRGRRAAGAGTRRGVGDGVRDGARPVHRRPAPGGRARRVGRPRGATRCRARAIEAATSLAEESLLVEDLPAVVRACRFGLGLDRYQDGLWRMLIAARERGGEAGAATRERREYALVLQALGVPAEVAAAG